MSEPTQRESGRFVFGPGFISGNHAYCGVILWDTEEMGPAPACVTEYVRLRQEGKKKEAMEMATELLRRYGGSDS